MAPGKPPTSWQFFLLTHNMINAYVSLSGSLPQSVQIFIKKAQNHIHGKVKDMEHYFPHQALVPSITVTHWACNLQSNTAAVSAGCSLAGAGGGGFLVAIAKSPDDRHRVEEIVNTSPVS